MLRRILVLICLLMTAPCYCQSTFANDLNNIDATVKTPLNVNIPTEKHRIRVGLALGGGGMRGAAHVGVLKVLLEEGVPIDLIAGTSIGSAVGGFYCAGVPMEKLSEQFYNATFMKEFMPIPLSLRIILAPILYMPRLFGYKPYDGLYKGGHCRRYADRLIGSQINIEQLPIPFAAICTNLVDGKVYRLTNGSLSLAMQASTSVPGLKKPVQIDDRLYCDGGLICNLPVAHVKEMGADFVIAVDIDERLKPVPLDKFRVPGSVSRQALRIQLNDQDTIYSQQADFVIHPDTNDISLISRKKKDGCRGIESGIKAAREAMPELKRKLAACGIQLASKDISSANTDEH